MAIHLFVSASPYYPEARYFPLLETASRAIGCHEAVRLQPSVSMRGRSRRTVRHHHPTDLERCRIRALMASATRTEASCRGWFFRLYHGRCGAGELDEVTDSIGRIGKLQDRGRTEHERMSGRLAEPAGQSFVFVDRRAVPPSRRRSYNPRFSVSCEL